MSETTTLHVHHAFLCISFLLLHDYNVKMPNFTFWRGRENTRQRLSYSFLELRRSLLEFKSRNLTNWTRWNKCYKVCSSATSLFKRHFLNRRCRCCLRVSIIISASPRKSRDLTVHESVLLYRLIALGDDGREWTLQRRSCLVRMHKEFDLTFQTITKRHRALFALRNTNL